MGGIQNTIAIPVIAVVFYTCTCVYPLQVSTMHMFLVQVIITGATLTMSVELKCEKKEQAQPFIKHYLQTLVQHNWLTPTPY